MNIVSQQTFHDAMFCTGVAVDITTTDGSAGRAGSAANAVYSMTDTPPTLLVYLNHGVSVWSVFNKNRTPCVSTLSVEQRPPSNLFGGKTSMEFRLAVARWQTGVTGYPQLGETPVSFDCRISQVVSVGTHDILSCAIEAIHRHVTPYGLMRFDRSYHALIRSAY